VLHGETGEPIEGVRVEVRTTLYKPWAPLVALEWSRVTSEVDGVSTTDSRGSFTSTVLAGIRRRSVHLFFLEPGLVVAPQLGGDSGHLTLMKKELLAAQTVYAYPVSATADLDVGSATVSVVGDGIERQIQFGDTAEAVWIRAGVPRSQPRPDKLPLTMRWVSALIHRAERFDPTAPEEGYLREWQGDIDCSDPTRASELLYVRSSSESYFGVVSMDFESLCRRSGKVALEYRFSRDAGVRELTSEDELALSRRPAGGETPGPLDARSHHGSGSRDDSGGVAHTLRGCFGVALAGAALVTLGLGGVRRYRAGSGFGRAILPATLFIALVVVARLVMPAFWPVAEFLHAALAVAGLAWGIRDRYTFV
jgi:hypothetical protein